MNITIPLDYNTIEFLFVLSVGIWTGWQQLLHRQHKEDLKKKVDIGE